MNVNCEIIKDLLPLYVDDIISADGKKLVEEHLATCEDCRKLAKSMDQSISISMDTDTTNIKGLKKKYKMSIWFRVFLITLVLLFGWFFAAYTLMSTWHEVFPRANVEGVKACTEIVIIGDSYYLHTNDFYGVGFPVSDTGYYTEEVHFYLGENGIHNLGLGRSFYMSEHLYPVGKVGITKKIVYTKPNGKGEVTLFEEGDSVTTLDGELKNFEDFND